jgi:predicted dehydrogenase
MKNERREFLKKAGLGAAYVSLGAFSQEDSRKNSSRKKHSHVQSFNMSGYSAPKIDTVRVGIIGLGQRGSSYVRGMILIEGVEIKALCDIRPEKVNTFSKFLEGTGHKPDLYAGGKDEWKKVCERKDIDLIILSTPWYMHADQGIYAMEKGKHVASEVPAASTIEECWKLVETSERTRRHFMMMENYSYMEFQLLTLNMARNDFFGKIVHGECAYNTSKIRNNFSKTMYWDMWWLKQYASRKGNIYPTHGLGPVCQIMDINRGDCLDFLVSVESNDFTMNAMAKELYKQDDFYKPFVNKDFRGNMNVTTIKTKEGRTIMLQHDASTPSPHNLIHGIYGTEGAALYDPPPPRLSIGKHAWVSQDEFDSLKEKHTPEIIKRMRERTQESGHGGSDLLIRWHLIDCLRNGLPVPQDVYDAASWSSILPLSEESVLNRSNSVDIPDFTSGAWKTNKRNMDINLERGGSTKIIT